MISTPGPMELVVILVIALIFLGPKRLPDAARSLGKGVREFRESLSGLDHDEDDRYEHELEAEAGDAVEPARDPDRRPAVKDA